MDAQTLNWDSVTCIRVINRVIFTQTAALNFYRHYPGKNIGELDWTLIGI